MTNDLHCPECGRRETTGPTYPPRCSCGSLWVDGEPVVEPVEVGRAPLWADPRDSDLLWKREDLNPTGSFKDRGAEALIRVAVDAGARRLVLDSSGSAALAGARVAARAGLPLRLHVPEGLGRVKRDALAALGAELVPGGDRAAAAARAEAEAGEAFWFSHVYHPAFQRGTAGSGREALAAGPVAAWVVPVGNGSLFLGLYRALETLAGAARLIAVQAEACPGLDPSARCGPSRARGIAVANPPRREEIRRAVAASGGRVITVSEAAIAEAEQRLHRRGVSPDPAAAAALAGVIQLRSAGEKDRLLAWMTGCCREG